MRLYDPLVTAVEYDGRVYCLKPWYDCVLRVYDIQSDAGYTDAEKLDVSLALLVRGRHPLDPRLLQAIFDALITIKHRGVTDKRTVDFTQDAPYIYAAFRQVYGIDLFDQRGKLHWQKFVALYASLPGDTRIMEIAGIRARKLPPPDKHNAQERAEIMRLKSIYALELSAEEREENMQRGLRNMAVALQSMAGGDGNG